MNSPCGGGSKLRRCSHLGRINSELMGDTYRLSQLEYRCKTKWSLDKYLNKASWQRIASLHAPDGRGERQFFIRGMHIPPRKVAKEIKRHGFLHKGNVSLDIEASLGTCETDTSHRKSPSNLGDWTSHWNRNFGHWITVGFARTQIVPRRF